MIFNCYLSCSFCPLWSQFIFHSDVCEYECVCSLHLVFLFPPPFVFIIIVVTSNAFAWFGARGFGVTKVVKFVFCFSSFIFCCSLLYVRFHSLCIESLCCWYVFHKYSVVVLCFCFFSFSSFHLASYYYCLPS